MTFIRVYFIAGRLFSEFSILNLCWWQWKKICIKPKDVLQCARFLMQRLQKFWHDNSICDHSTCHDFASSSWSRIWIAHNTKPCIVIIPSFVHAFPAMSFIASLTRDFAQVNFVVLWSHTSFLAHLSQKLKWALLIEICPQSALVVVNFSQFYILH